MAECVFASSRRERIQVHGGWWWWWSTKRHEMIFGLVIRACCNSTISHTPNASERRGCACPTANYYYMILTPTIQVALLAASPTLPLSVLDHFTTAARRVQPLGHAAAMGSGHGAEVGAEAEAGPPSPHLRSSLTSTPVHCKPLLQHRTTTHFLSQIAEDVRGLHARRS
jgi:hypothetical protein